MTIPGPPPYGTSSTWRWRSVVKSRRSQMRTSRRPRSRARASNDTSRAANAFGKIEIRSTRTGLSLRPRLEPVRQRDTHLPGLAVNVPNDRAQRRHEDLAGWAAHDVHVVGRRAQHLG